MKWLTYTIFSRSAVSSWVLTFLAEISYTAFFSLYRRVCWCNEFLAFVFPFYHSPPRCTEHREGHIKKVWFSSDMAFLRLQTENHTKTRRLTKWKIALPLPRVPGATWLGPRSWWWCSGGCPSASPRCRSPRRCCPGPPSCTCWPGGTRPGGAAGPGHRCGCTGYWI